MATKVVAKSAGSLSARFAGFIQRRSSQSACRAACVGLMVVLAPAAPAAVLAELILEQLMNESVTSVSKKPTQLNDAPAAISVITAEDLARPGITTIPEALHLVRGLAVAPIRSRLRIRKRRAGCRSPGWAEGRGRCFVGDPRGAPASPLFLKHALDLGPHQDRLEDHPNFHGQRDDREPGEHPIALAQPRGFRAERAIE